MSLGRCQRWARTLFALIPQACLHSACEEQFFGESDGSLPEWSLKVVWFSTYHEIPQLALHSPESGSCEVASWAPKQRNIPESACPAQNECESQGSLSQATRPLIAHRT